MAMDNSKTYILIMNAVIEIKRETEKALWLENIDNAKARAWVPKSALVASRDVKFANGIIATRYDVQDWFWRKASWEHDIVFGRGI